MRFKTSRFILTVGILLVFCVITTKVSAKEDLGIYIFGYADCVDEVQWRKALHQYDNYPMKRDKEGDRERVIPSAVAKDYFMPGPDEKLWVFYDSKLIGTTKVKEYALGGGAYQNDHAFFKTRENFNLRSSNVPHYVIYLTVPPETSPENLPREYHLEHVSKKYVQGILEKSAKKRRFPQDDFATKSFDQSFQVMGKKYVVLSLDTGVSKICAVFCVDQGNIVEVKRIERAYD